MFLAILVLTPSYSVEISNHSIEELKQDENIIDYVSSMNNYDYNETKELILNIEDKYEFMVVELIIPSIFIIFGYFLLIISLKDILTLTKNITIKKQIFTENKYQLLKKMSIRTDIALLFLLNNLFLWVIVGLLIEIILYLFNCCVESQKNKGE